MQDRYGLTTSGTVLQKTPFSFDVSVWEFFWPLMTGARLHVARPGGHQDPAYLAQVIQDETVTVVHFVPSMLRVFLEEPDSANCRSLRHVICSGEALTHDLQERFFQRFDCELHNLYGPTEAAVDVTHWTCRRGNTSRVVPIGRPVANTRIHILDDAMCPLPPGQAGELCIGGVQVGRGYHRRPDLTTERFIPDPFTAVPGARLYRTGDLARWMPDGNIEYLGRSDFQVKIRGFRIELGEIEDALASHPAVRQAVVVADDTDSGEKRLVGYLSLRADLPANDAGLRAHLAAQLPDYMVPAVFVRLPHIPLSPNGKVDRNSLPRPPRDRPELPQPAVPPQSPLQRQIALLWEAVLGIDGIGIDDRFFELGGSSLGVADLHRRLQDLLGRTFPITELFAAATIRLQAERLSPGRKDEARMDAAQERARRQRESFNLRRPARPS
jgi:acyl-coenzyme A synthetase/AMP-(fatty) acid ligase